MITTVANILINLQRESDAKKALPSFWVPSQTPENSHGTAIQPVKLQPMCPAALEKNEHTISLKTLVTVHFSEEEDTKSKKKVRNCPACSKTLSNSTKAMRKSSVPAATGIYY